MEVNVLMRVYTEDDRNRILCSRSTPEDTSRGYGSEVIIV